MRTIPALMAMLLPLAAFPVQAEQGIPATVSVCFTPGQNCEGRIVAAIDASRSSIKVQAYYLTSKPIIQALQRAAARGVDVTAVLDQVNNRKYSGATLLLAKGIPVWIDDDPKIAHNKLIIIDSHLVIGGSFNYTASAQKRNAENVTFMESKALAKRFADNWIERRNASKVFGAGRTTDALKSDRRNSSHRSVMSSLRGRWPAKIP